MLWDQVAGLVRRRRSWVRTTSVDAAGRSIPTSDTPHAAARTGGHRDLGWLRYLHRKATTPDVTPAWREVYAGILDELIFRHTGWWAAEDWLTGSWWRLANVGPGDRFTEPTVVDVDFPAVALREARWTPTRARGPAR